MDRWSPAIRADRPRSAHRSAQTCHPGAVEADLDAVQRTYGSALARLLDDLRLTTGLTPRVTIDFTDPGGLPFSFEGRSMSVLSLTTDLEEASVRVADLVQDEILDELWGPAWPECPGHSHPASPRLVGARGSWVCPKTGDIVSLIGHLGEDS